MQYHGLIGVLISQAKFVSLDRNSHWLLEAGPLSQGLRYFSAHSGAFMIVTLTGE